MHCYAPNFEEVEGANWFEPVRLLFHQPPTAPHIPSRRPVPPPPPPPPNYFFRFGFFGLNTILFQKYFKYTCIIDIQQIDQDLIVSSWLIYIISWNVHNLQQNRWFKHMGHMTWKYSMVSNGKSKILILKISKLINERTKQKKKKKKN